MDWEAIEMITEDDMGKGERGNKGFMKVRIPD